MTFGRTASINQTVISCNRLIYLNISIGISIIHDPRPLCAPKIFITTSGETTSRYLFHEVDNAASYAITIICENNYSRYSNCFRKTLHRRYLTGF